ncbi:hypothetical protein GLOIN_2v1877169 [Rhizophagus clarus]|uniref:TLDc domain-containing protein n=1 Tax=Rhizophagus clarus TaxID=94130 RepID=A0A8H3LYI1_9GLOM|nr:hypothetical protein GLOIN_2v1877169 [Rhizophagus clarus]
MSAQFLTKLIHIKLPNISSEIFQIILKYIYGGILSLNMDDVSDFIKVLVAADNLHLQELVDYLQKYLIKNKLDWIEQNFGFTQHISSQSNNLLFSLSSREFSQKVRPYQKLLDQQLYEDLLNSYLDPGSVSNDNILRPRKIIDSQIVDSNIVSTVSKWVDKMDINDDNYRELYLPYKFELLLRGSRDGFTPKKFHGLCDGKPNTVAFIKVKGTEEILGGYNPVKWKTTGYWGKTKDSFIFSFKNKNIKDAILSKVIDANHALDYSTSCGPKFGSDLIMSSYDKD